MSWIKTQKGKTIVLLIEEVFKKAKNESAGDNGNSISEYLSNTIEREFNKHIASRTFNRYYDQYISSITTERTKPYDNTLDVLSRYLKYDGFKDFVKRNEDELEKLKREHEEELERRKKKLWISGVGNLVLLLTLIFFISKYYKKNCMIWVDDHYEKIRCSGLENEVKFDPVLLENFKLVPLCDTTMIVRNDKVALWYDKSDNKVTTFTYPGKHPTNGKTLKQMTPGIKKKYSVKCDSIKNIESKGKS